MENTLTRLLAKFPDKDWDYDALSANTNIELDYIEENAEKPWNFQFVSFNVNVDSMFIERHKDKNWNYKALSSYVYGKENISMDVFSRRIPLEYALENKHQPWEWNIILLNVELPVVEKLMHEYLRNLSCLNYHDNLTFDFIDNHPEIPWNFKKMSSLISFNLDLVKERDYLCWSWYSISYNTNLDTHFVEKYLLDKYVCWKAISFNKNITCSDIERYSLWPWDWVGVSMNPNLTVEFIERNWHKCWSFEHLSNAQCLTCSFLDRHLDINWNWKNISSNIFIDVDILKKYSHFPWDFTAMSLNRHLSVDIVTFLSTKDWDWKRISRNELANFLSLAPAYDYYKKRAADTNKKNNTLKEELLIAAFHPTRFLDWCISCDDRQFLNKMSS